MYHGLLRFTQLIVCCTESLESNRDELVWVANADGSLGGKSRAGLALERWYLSCIGEPKTEHGASDALLHPDAVSHKPSRGEQSLPSAC